ncbi:uncharacterized protein LOC111320009 [Stylophora pistillata]|uniref:uncharacterized protein LOC111320009 n=1 Tax=Stylophora pistillata TaxID=50429 RepID=UPI000C052838|nr:uncharacterized protein LOC111320009 [Stylophora pistillata]
MPGRKCAVFGFGSCRWTKGIGIWKLPKAVDVKHREWRESWLGQLKKTRVIDSDFREQIKNDRVNTCEKRFSPKDFEIFSTDNTTPKKPRFDPLSKLNMPTKSIESRKPTLRPERRHHLADSVCTDVNSDVC